MLALLQETTEQIPAWLQATRAWATIFQGFATPLLIAIGGGFAWYKFFRQGEHEPRLQAIVTTEEVTVRDNVAYIIAKVSVQTRLAHFAYNLLTRWWTSYAKWVRLPLGRSHNEEAMLATRRRTSLAPLNKEAGKKQRKTVVALKQARNSGKNGKANTK